MNEFQMGAVVASAGPLTALERLVVWGGGGELWAVCRGQETQCLRR